MISLKYSKNQRVAPYFFTVSCDFNLNSSSEGGPLLIAAYNSVSSYRNFVYVTNETFHSSLFQEGTLAQDSRECLNGNFKAKCAIRIEPKSEIDPELMTVVLLRTKSKHLPCGKAGLVAVAHFDVEMEPRPPTESLELTGLCDNEEEELTTVRFNTCTFEQIGGMVYLLPKRKRDLSGRSRYSDDNRGAAFGDSNDRCNILANLPPAVWVTSRRVPPQDPLGFDAFLFDEDECIHLPKKRTH